MFDENFRVCFADTPFGVALHQRIRYQVFCLDKGFEDPSAFSTAQETDTWDDQSAHFIVQNKKTLQWVAATLDCPAETWATLPVDSLGAFDRHRLDPPLSRVGDFALCIIPNKALVEADAMAVPEPNSLQAWGSAQSVAVSSSRSRWG